MAASGGKSIITSSRTRHKKRGQLACSGNTSAIQHRGNDPKNGLFQHGLGRVGAITTSYSTYPSAIAFLLQLDSTQHRVCSGTANAAHQAQATVGKYKIVRCVTQAGAMGKRLKSHIAPPTGYIPYPSLLSAPNLPCSGHTRRGQAPDASDNATRAGVFTGSPPERRRRCVGGGRGHGTDTLFCSRAAKSARA